MEPGGARGDNAFRQAQALPLAGGMTPLMHAMANTRGGMFMGPGGAMGDDDGLFNGLSSMDCLAAQDNPFAAGAWQGDGMVGARMTGRRGDMGLGQDAMNRMA
jgi:hypothetical protein